MKLTALEFGKAEASMSVFVFWNVRLVLIEQGVFFVMDAILLYTSIFFLVSIMNDLSQ